MRLDIEGQMPQFFQIGVYKVKGVSRSFAQASKHKHPIRFLLASGTVCFANPTGKERGDFL
jgi:hypothetical protein